MRDPQMEPDRWAALVARFVDDRGVEVVVYRDESGDEWAMDADEWAECRGRSAP